MLQPFFFKVFTNFVVVYTLSMENGPFRRLSVKSICVSTIQEKCQTGPNLNFKFPIFPRTELNQKSAQVFEQFERFFELLQLFLRGQAALLANLCYFCHIFAKMINKQLFSRAVDIIMKQSYSSQEANQSFNFFEENFQTRITGLHQH